MPSLQPVEQQQPPPMAMTQQASHSGGGSVGAVIAVLAVIFVLGVIAGVIGRLCAGGRVFGFGHFDIEGWMDRKWGPCIDGRLEAPPPPPAPAVPSSSADGAGRRAIPIVIPMEVAPEGGIQHAAAHTARRAA